MLFVGVLPLVSPSADHRAAMGMAIALCSLAGYREAEPFKRKTTNILVVVACYTTLLTFGAALAIDVELDRGIQPVAFGAILIAVGLQITIETTFNNISAFVFSRYSLLARSFRSVFNPFRSTF